MPADFSGPEKIAPRQTDEPMFAPTPLWDRDARKRRGGRAVARRTARDPALDAGEAGAGLAAVAEPVDTVYETQPASSAEPTGARRRGVSASVVAAGVVAAALIGAVGWYESQPHDNGVAELTPGAATRTALNSAAPPSASPLAALPAPAAQTPPTSTPPATVAARAPTHRVRPAESNSAMDAAVNASTTAPVIATPAPSLAPTTAPTTSTGATPLNPAPTPSTPSVAAPQPGPVNPAPSSEPTATP